MNKKTFRYFYYQKIKKYTKIDYYGVTYSKHIITIC